VSRTARRQRERRDAEEQDEKDSETALTEKAHETPDGLVALASQPTLELVAEPLAGLAGLSPASHHLLP